jgi:hypothetical protein
MLELFWSLATDGQADLRTAEGGMDGWCVRAGRGQQEDGESVSAGSVRGSEGTSRPTDLRVGRFVCVVLSLNTGNDSLARQLD